MPLDNPSVTHLRDFIGGVAKTIENFIRMLPKFCCPLPNSSWGLG